MPETKNPLASKTVWGAILMLAAVILGQFGFDLPPEDQATLIDKGFAAADGVLGVVGFIVALIGRWTAKKAIAL